MQGLCHEADAAAGKEETSTRSFLPWLSVRKSARALFGRAKPSQDKAAQEDGDGHGEPRSEAMDVDEPKAIDNSMGVDGSDVEEGDDKSGSEAMDVDEPEAVGSDDVEAERQAAAGGRRRRQRFLIRAAAGGGGEREWERAGRWRGAGPSAT